MAAAILQGVGATTALSSVNYKNSCFASRRSLSGLPFLILFSLNLSLIGSLS